MIKEHNPLISPNLPSSRLRAVLIDGRFADILGPPLAARGITVLMTRPSPLLDEPVCGHPDMLFHHLGGADIVCAGQCEPEGALSSLGFEQIKAASVLSPEYPQDIALNAARVGGIYIHRLKSTDPAITRAYIEKGITAVDTKQGYSKCSTAIVDAGSVITADPSVNDAVLRAGLSCLLINEGHIALPGYGHGFIGGATGKLSSDEIAFTGRLENHPDYERIIGFLKVKGIRPVYLTEKPCFDAGSIIPLTE